MAMFSLSSDVLPAGVTVARPAGTYSGTNSVGFMAFGSAVNVPRLEYSPAGSRSNYLLWSQDFVPLSTAALPVTAGATDANLGSTAGRAVPSTDNVNHNIYQAARTNLPATNSFYAKADGYSLIGFFNRNTGTYAVFNLANGTVVSSSGLSARVDAAANGFYRLSAVDPSDNVKSWDLVIPPPSYTSGSPFVPFAGDGVSGVIIWRGQIEPGTVPTDYILTTNATGTVSTVAVSSIKGRLLEPPRTNRLLQSGTPGGASWLTASWTAAAGAIPAASYPALSKVSFGVKAPVSRTYQANQAPAGTIQTASFYVRLGFLTNYAAITQEGATITALFDLRTGQVAFSTGVIAAGVEALPDGVFRVWATFVRPSSGTYVFFWLSTATTASGGGGINHQNNGRQTTGTEWGYAGGAMLEDGDKVSSYIANTTTATTRPGETLTLNWAAHGIADGQYSVLYAFADGSMQAIEQQVAWGTATISAASLKSYTIRSVSILQTPAARSVTIGDRALRSTALTDIGSRVATIRN